MESITECRSQGWSQSIRDCGELLPEADSPWGPGHVGEYSGEVGKRVKRGRQTGGSEKGGKQRDLGVIWGLSVGPRFLLLG